MKTLLVWLMGLQAQGYETVTIAEVINRIRTQQAIKREWPSIPAPFTNKRT